MIGSTNLRDGIEASDCDSPRRLLGGRNAQSDKNAADRARLQRL